MADRCECEKVLKTRHWNKALFKFVQIVDTCNSPIHCEDGDNLQSGLVVWDYKANQNIIKNILRDQLCPKCEKVFMTSAEIKKVLIIQKFSKDINLATINFLKQLFNI